MHLDNNINCHHLEYGYIKYYDNFDGTQTSVYSTFTPLGSVIIPKENQVNNINSITLVFNDQSGSIMLREVAVDKSL